ncbi:homeodomain interacting protein kinase isoform a [Anaeramoeba flamelloides]|uniref:Homeodomain interacting protein kinase isoform a n=1 Tax=Anaeramoeba flamelloides TaxID=1746091 RepID=A0AAV7YBW0_9EUKA|nr:homeodomain interacting protein kinase isoform a [Anaeramoeba flamelloides]
MQKKNENKTKLFTERAFEKKRIIKKEKKQQKIQNIFTEKEKSLVVKFTKDLLITFKKCNDQFNYETTSNPRRALTKNKIPFSNNSQDNSEGELIVYVNDSLGSHNNKYIVVGSLGSGTFAQVFNCKNIQTKEEIGIKVIKNLPAYFNQALIEIQILTTLKKSGNIKSIVGFEDYFLHKNHLCLVFEILSVNLFELIRMNHYRGLPMKLVLSLANDIIRALILLYDNGIIHCDLKPENILLENPYSINVKIIDFGSACFIHKTRYSYIQSRYYRSPEVLLRLPYTEAIDMWSLGCIIAELFIGLPLFPGSSEYDQLSRIIQMRGNIPKEMVENGRVTKRYYDFIDNQYILKSREQYSIENRISFEKTRKIFNYTTLKEIILNCQLKKNITKEEFEKDQKRKLILIDLLEGLLQIDPDVRWNAKEAYQHPFFTGKPFTDKFIPKRDRKRKKYSPNSFESKSIIREIEKKLVEKCGFVSSSINQIKSGMTQLSVENISDQNIRIKIENNDENEKGNENEKENENKNGNGNGNGSRNGNENNNINENGGEDENVNNSRNDNNKNKNNSKEQIIDELEEFDELFGENNSGNTLLTSTMINKTNNEQTKKQSERILQEFLKKRSLKEKTSANYFNNKNHFKINNKKYQSKKKKKRKTKYGKIRATKRKTLIIKKKFYDKEKRSKSFNTKKKKKKFKINGKKVAKVNQDLYNRSVSMGKVHSKKKKKKKELKLPYNYLNEKREFSRKRLLEN